MKRINRMLLMSLLTLSCTSCNTEKEVADYQVIPLPQEISLTSEEKPFTLNAGTLIAYPNNNLLLKKNAEFLSEYLQETLGYTLEVKEVTPDTDVKNRTGSILWYPNIKKIHPRCEQGEDGSITGRMYQR